MIPIIGGAIKAVAGLANTVLGRVLPNMTEREKLTREQQKKELDARERMRKVKERDLDDSLGGGTF